MKEIPTETIRTVPPVKQPAPVPQPIKHGRLATAWMTLAVSVIVLLFLMIFILQNNLQVRIHYLGLQATLSFGVAILLAAIAGSILTLLIGTARIVQLKHSEKHQSLHN